jgi:hypothetical protein
MRALVRAGNDCVSGLEEGKEESTFMLKCKREREGISGVVGWAAVHSARAQVSSAEQSVCFFKDSRHSIIVFYLVARKRVSISQRPNFLERSAHRNRCGRQASSRWPLDWRVALLFDCRAGSSGLWVQGLRTVQMRRNHRCVRPKAQRRICHPLPQPRPWRPP